MVGALLSAAILEQGAEFHWEAEGVEEKEGQRQRSQTTTVRRLLLQLGAASIGGNAKNIPIRMPILTVGSFGWSFSPQQSQLEVGDLWLLRGSHGILLYLIHNDMKDTVGSAAVQFW